MDSPEAPRSAGIHLSGRALALALILVGVVGAMAVYRSHVSLPMVWSGITHSTEAPLPESAVAPLIAENAAQEKLAERVAPAVVQVNVTAHTTPSDSGMPPDNPLSQFFGQFPHRPQFEQGVGSGIIVSPDGFIVTNNHVVKDATSITVVLYDQRQLPAKVVGTDALTDLAVIKIDASGLPNLPWGDSHALKQGDLVYAFGNPFGQQLQFTMTHGIISGKGRIPSVRSDLRAPGDYLQTDAAINPGNSGGPLVNVRGEVVGVNAFIYTSTGTFSGEAFAIPSEIAQPISAMLIAKGKVVRGYLGITLTPMTPDMAHFFGVPPSAKGALISQVTPGQAGAQGGLKNGDLIVRFNGQPVDDATQLQLDTASTPPGTHATIGILRDGKPVTLHAVMGIAPEDETKAASGGAAAPSAAGVQVGVELQDITQQDRDHYQLGDEVKGALIRGVTPGGPAYNASLAPGLVITAVNRVPTPDTAAVRAELQKLPPGKDVLLSIYQGGPQPGSVYIVVHPAPNPGE
jgi:serine protease Do